MFSLGRVPVRRARFVAALLLAAALVSGCGSLAQTAPAPTPADFPGIAGLMTVKGLEVGNIVSGDAGCSDANLSKTAIAFDASGKDQATPVRMYIYIFRNRETYERLRASVDQCAATYITDPATYESVETSPFVVAGQGPWGPTFKETIRAAITEAAGTGG